MTPGERRTYWIFTLAPFVGTAVILGILLLAWPTEEVGLLLGHWVFSYFVIGRFIVLWPAMHADCNHTAIELACMVLWYDVATAMFVTANLAWLHDAPWIGKRIVLLEKNGQKTLAENPTLDRFAWLGVVLFVLFPMTGTGAIGGSILGRLIGLEPWRIVLAVAIGVSILLIPLTYLSTELAPVLEPLQKSPWFSVIGIAIVAAVFVWLFYRAKKLERQAGAEAPPPPPPPPSSP